MTPLKDKEVMKPGKYVIYGKKSFAMLKVKKANMPFIIKSEIIVIKSGNLEELLTIFAT